MDKRSDTGLAKYVTVKVRRDAETFCAAEVFEHELRILYGLYGQENIEVGVSVLKREIDARSEYERLIRKYGEATTTGVYAHPGRLADALEPANPPDNGSDKGKTNAASP
jgi:hypothetical protein